MMLPDETKAAKRSTINGAPQVHSVAGTSGYYDVPSYFARRGRSIDEAAASLGLRVLGRREVGVRDDVVAEIHESGVAGTYLCVPVAGAR